MRTTAGGRPLAWPNLPPCVDFFRDITLAPADAGRLVHRREPRWWDELACSPPLALLGVAAAGPIAGAGAVALDLSLSAGITVAAFAVAGLIVGARREALRRWRLGRYAAAVPLLHDVGATGAGAVVRVRGDVVAHAPFVSPGSGQAAVVATYRGTIARVRSWLGGRVAVTETRAVDFDVALPSGQSARVSVSGPMVFLDELARPGAAGRRSALFERVVALPGGRTGAVVVDDEALLSPGDAVEVVGTLDHVVEADGDRATPRGLPRRAVLRGSARRPLIVVPLTRRAGDPSGR